MSFSEFRAILAVDRARYNPGERPKSGWQVYLICPGFRFTFWFRLRQFCSKGKMLRILLPLLTGIVLRLKLKTGIQIHPASRIGPGLYMPHFGGIVVNPKAVIGKNLYLSHNVLIGKIHAGPREGVPTIGDDVYIGTGSAILGNVTIGDGAAVAINSVVVDDVPAGHFVAGSPARVVSEKSASEILGYVRE